MPELPEIETVSRALKPVVTGKVVSRVVSYRPNLREPIADVSHLVGQQVVGTDRRSKYLKLQFATGDVLIHLGMSGFLHWADGARDKHDHWEMHFTDGSILRLRDHRRFGAVLWQTAGDTHPSLSHLGPEPLTELFDGALLQQQVGRKNSPIKSVIMDASVVVGVGNIYATEALYLTGIDPRSPAQTLTAKHFDMLARNIQFVLREGIRLGGATLRDYHSVDGSDGLFATVIKVYGRAGEACGKCGSIIQSQMIGGRNSFWCPKCQKLGKAKTKTKTKTKK